MCRFGCILIKAAAGWATATAAGRAHALARPCAFPVRTHPPPSIARAHHTTARTLTRAITYTVTKIRSRTRIHTLPTPTCGGGGGSPPPPPFLITTRSWRAATSGGGGGDGDGPSHSPHRSVEHIRLARTLGSIPCAPKKHTSHQ